MNNNVFVNRTLNMKQINYIGLDMDHTLIRYHSHHFESLVYKLVVDELVNNHNYPIEIKNFKFNFSNAIRGLVVDSKHGNILKLSRYGAIRQSYHGTQPVSYHAQKKMYRSIYIDLRDPNYIAIDTAFSISFCVLYGQLVDYKDQNPHALPDYNKLAFETLQAVNYIHSQGELKKTISNNFDHFVLRDPKVVHGLKRMMRYGKKIFLLTNSEAYYTKNILDYAITPYMNEGETWHDLFEFIITSANKPRFFYENLPFEALNDAKEIIDFIHPGIYQGGNATQFSHDLSLNGDEILYIGDHIYGDILRLKKACNWRTALVVEELGHEITAQKHAMRVEQNIEAAMTIKKNLEYQYMTQQSYRIEKNITTEDPSFNQLHSQLYALDKQIAKLLQEQKEFYNPFWGRVFRAGAEESYFAHQVERFACIYMEKLSDLLSCSPLTYFRATQRKLPHDLL